MTLEKLSDITTTNRGDYYDLLLTHHALIIEEVGKTSKKTVSKALHIMPSAFSGVYGCILAYNRLVKHD